MSRRYPQAVYDAVLVNAGVSDRGTTEYSVGIVSAGRVGAVLGAALIRAGHRVAAVAAESRASRERASLLLPGVPVLPAADVARRAELLLLAVPDDVVRGLAGELAEAGCVRPGTLVVHTSGRHGLGVLDSLSELGAVPMAVHPAMTFTGTAADLQHLATATFGLTTWTDSRAVAEALVASIGGDAVWIADAKRPLYHAALTVGSNYLITLTAEASRLLRSSGVAEPAQVLEPLLRAALVNALRLGDAALTGPISRGDAGSVKAHMAALSEFAPEVVSSYVALGELTTRRAMAEGLLSAVMADSILEALGRARP
jgi:predicted short-subunit dehydrogenase-like oxidoreductase (DUF2520 family)